MSAATAPPNLTYIEGTSKAISADPINNMYVSLNKDETCEIVEATSRFDHKGKMYSNGPFINATLQNDNVGGRYGYTKDEDLPKVKLSNGTERSIPPKGLPSFYFVIKDTRPRSRSKEPPPHAEAAPTGRKSRRTGRPNPSHNLNSDGGTVKRRFRAQKRQKQTMRPCNIRRRQRRTHAICRRRRNKNKTH
jgi:hypothetical protein